MCFWRLKEKIANKNFKIFWEKGISNWADYFTKHFSPKVHQALRPKYIHKTNAVIRALIMHILKQRTCKGVLEPSTTGTDRACVRHADVSRI